MRRLAKVNSAWAPGSKFVSMAAGAGSIGTEPGYKPILPRNDSFLTDSALVLVRGCVSGAQIQHMQDKIRQADGSYNWDMIDGYDELEYVHVPVGVRHVLFDSVTCILTTLRSDHPDLQEKIRRVVTQGHIDPEDFRGDPELNVPGEKGIRRRAKRAKKSKDEEEDEEDTEPVSPVINTPY